MFPSNRSDYETTHHTQPANTLAFLLGGGDYSDPSRLNVGYATGQHTAGAVPVALYGAGTRAAQLGLVDNTDLFGWMTQAIGVRHENPMMTEEEAMEILKGLPDVPDSESKRL